jgi:tRNA-specific adenosine deaminase 1
MINDINNQKDFGEFIYNLVNEFYSSYILKSSKPQENQWTIISSIIMENNNKYKIICFSNGTKSLPNLNYKSRKFQLFDCHTEILTLRCFKFFLLNALIFHLDKTNGKKIFNKTEFELFDSYKEFYDIFEFNEKSNKFKIKDSIKFHLYISENPCGECSNIEYRNNNGQDIKQISGGKTLEECLNLVDNNTINKFKETKQKIDYKFMTKSIRSDFKPNYLSYSLSCTDKIMLRNILGYQGKYLSFILEPIYINNIIINTSLTNTKENINSFKECLNYNLRNNTMDYQCKIPEIHFVNHKDDDYIFKGNKNDKNSLSFSSYWYFPNNLKKVDPSNGIKTGGNIKDIDKIDFLRVKISNYDFCKNLFNILINFKNKKIFGKAINKIEKYLLKDIKNIDFCDLIEILIDGNYAEKKFKILDENINAKKFIGKKRNILKKNLLE